MLSLNSGLRDFSNTSSKALWFARSGLSPVFRTVATETPITVKAQGGLTPDLAWMDPVTAVCAAFPRFVVVITGPGYFGDAVVYLGIASGSIRELHQQLIEATSPDAGLVERYFEGARYMPHLTLGQTAMGLTPSQLEEMGREATGFLKPFPTFEVTSVRIYREVNNRHEPFRDVPLV